MKIAIISDTHDNLATLEKAVNWMNENGIEEIIHCGDICSLETLKELSKIFTGKIHLVFGNVDPVVEFRQSFPKENSKARSEPKFHYGVDDKRFTIAKKAPQDMPNVILYGEVGEIELFEDPPSPKASARLFANSNNDPRTYENHNAIQPSLNDSSTKANKKIAFCHHPNLARKLAQTGKYDLVFYGHTHQPWEETINNCRLVNPGNLSNMLYKATFAVYNTETDKLELKILEKLEGDTDTQIPPG